MSRVWETGRGPRDSGWPRTPQLMIIIIIPAWLLSFLILQDPARHEPQLARASPTSKASLGQGRGGQVLAARNTLVQVSAQRPGN